MSFLLTPRHVELARLYCENYHHGQFRKGSNEPYWKHPLAVAEILERYGYSDPVTQCIALLHDIVEDTPLKMDEIIQIFGYEISNGVYVLSRNTGKMKEGRKLSPEEYVLRLSFARKKIKRVKIADMIDNTKDLETLALESREKKIKVAEDAYIPWGRQIAPLLIQELVANIENYLEKMIARG